MTNQIENKVVSMTFDNAEFAKKISDTIVALDNLTESLKLADGTSGLKKLTESIDDVDLNPIESALDSINSKMSLFSVGMATAVAKLTSGTMDAIGGSISDIWEKTLGGGKRRYLAIEQAEFMLEGLGVSVKDAMADAKAAVEGTAYGLDEASKSVASLSAAGVALGPDMVNSLKGIAGAAGMTNVSFGEIGEIYKKMAGDKVTNQALQQFESRGLAVRSKMAELMKVSESELKNMVANDQISFEKFAELMNRGYGEHAKSANKTYSGAAANLQSAFNRIGAMIQGDFLESKRKVMVSVIPVVDQLKTALEPLVKVFHVLYSTKANKMSKYFDGLKLDTLKKGLDTLANAFWYLLLVIKRVLDPVRKTLDEVFPGEKVENFSKGLLAVSTALMSLTRGWYANENRGKAITFVLQTLVYTFRIVIDVIKGLAKVAYTAFNTLFSGLFNVKKSSGDLTDFTKGLREIRDWMKRLSEGGGVTDFFDKIAGKTKSALTSFKNIFSGITSGVSGVVNAFKRLGKAIASLFGGDDNDKIKAGSVGGPWWTDGGIFKKQEKSISTFERVVSRLADAWRLFTGALKTTGDAGLSIGKLFSSIAGFVGRVVIILASGLIEIPKAIFNLMRKIMGGIGDGIAGENFDRIFGALLDTAWSSVLLSIARLIYKGGDSMGSITGILNGLEDVVTNVAATITEFGKVLKAVALEIKANALLKISFAIAVLTATLIVLSKIPANDLAKAVTALGTIGVGLALFMKSMSRATTTFSSAKDMLELSVSLIALSVAIFIIALAMKQIADLNEAEIEKGMGVLRNLLIYMTFFVVALQASAKVGGSVKGTAAALLGMAIAIRLLVKVIKTLGSMDYDVLERGLGALVKIMAIIAISMRVIGNSQTKNAAKAMMGIAIAVRLLVKAVEKLGMMEPEVLKKGLISVGVLIMAITAALDLIPKDSRQKATSVILIALSILILTEAISRFKDIDGNTIAKGLLTFAIILAGITFALKQMNPNDTYGAAAAILAIGIALLLISYALKVVSTIDPGSLLISVGAIVVLIESITRVAKSKQDSVKASIAILATAFAIMVIGRALSTVSKLNIFGLIASTIAISAILMAVAKVAETGSDRDSMFAIIAAAGAILAIALALTILNFLNPRKILAGTLAIAGLLYMVAYVAEKVGEKDNVKGILAATAAIAAIALGLYILANLPVSGILMAGLVIVGLLEMVIRVSKKTSNKKSIKGILSAAAAIGTITLALLILSKIEVANLLMSGLVIAGLMEMVIRVSKETADRKATKGLATAAGAIIIIALALKVLANIEASRLLAAGLAIGGVLAVIMLTSKEMSNKKSTKGLTTAIIAIAAIGAALYLLAGIEASRLLAAGLGIAAVMFVIATSSEILGGKDNLKGVKGAALAIFAITVAFKILSDIEASRLFAAGVALAFALLAVAAISMVLDNKSNLKGALGAAAIIVVIAMAIATLAKIKMKPLVIACLALAAVLIAVAAAAYVIGSGGKDNTMAIAAAAAAILLIAISLKLLADMDLASMAIAVLGLVVLLAAIAAVLVVLTYTGAAAAVPALVAMAAALIIMALAIKVLADIPIAGIITGIIALAAMLLIVLAAGLLAMVVAPGLLVLAAAMVAIGLGVLGLGLGALLAAQAFKIFVETMRDNLDFIIPIIDKIIEIMKTKGGEFAEAAITLAIDFLVALGNGAGRLAGAMVIAAVSFIDELLKAIKTAIEDHGESIMDNIIAIVDAMTALIKEKGPRLVESLGNLGRAFVRAIWDGIKAVVKDFDFGNILKDILDAAIAGIKGVAGFILDPLKDAIKDLFGGASDEADKALDSHSPSRVYRKKGQNMGDGLVLGIRDKKKDVRSEMKSTLDDAKKDIEDKLKSGMFKNVGGAEGGINPTISPVLDLSNVEKEAGKLNGILSPNSIQPNVTNSKASDISSLMEALKAGKEEKDNKKETTLNFTQNNYSPEALSANDIYKKTKGQVAKAKEELGIAS